MHAIDRRIAPMAIILSLIVWTLASAQSSEPARATRSISAAHALPESTVRVTLVLTADRDLTGVSLDERVPVGWTIHPLDNDGAAFKRSTGTWVFPEPIRAGGTRRIIYELAIPEAGRLFRDPLPQCFHIDGTLQSTVPAFELPIAGDESIEVMSYLPVTSAIAHLLPETAHDPDRIDLRLSEWVEADQLERALELWRDGAPVPGTGGSRIDLATIDRLAAYHETCTPVDSPLPLTLDPLLAAVRTIRTSLPGDSVLLSERCLDPGLSARRFSVTVEITSDHDAYGIGYRESFPARWRVTPIRHDGWWYRDAATEWVYPGRLAAGETLHIVYTVEVLPSPGDDLAESDGCCGRSVPLIGEVTSALGCEESPVGGDGSIYVWRCLPVILAISRWNGVGNRFDATLSDRITFDQVQRAVDFWLTEEPVPHTCGYTVGYETLKEIVAYWLSGDPVTGPLPGAPVAGCDLSGAVDCAERDGGIAWFCEMANRQDDTDRVGPQLPAPLVVDAGPDREITCATPTATLAADAGPASDALRYLWLDPSGRPISNTRSVIVDAPGAYSVIVESEDGCRGTDSVVVTADREPPTVRIAPPPPLTCAEPEHTLVATVSGGRPPYSLAWSGPDGEPLGAGPDLRVLAPGRYTLTVTGANGCIGSETVTVPGDVGSPAIDLAVEGLLTCVTQTVSVVATIRGDRGPYAVEWTDADDAVVSREPRLIVDRPGIYNVRAVGINGCPATASIEVREEIEPPCLDAGPDVFLTCASPIARLTPTLCGGGEPYEVRWTNECGDVVGIDLALTVQRPGIYTIRAVGPNGCPASDQVRVYSRIDPATVDAGPDRSLTCEQASVDVVASVSGGTPPYLFQWHDACGVIVGRSATLTVTVPGEYTITVTTADGCISSDVVRVTSAD